MLQMQDLLAQSYREFKEGSIVKGRVLEIRPREVLVDIGYKSEGLLPIGEVTGYDNTVKVKPGEEIEVLLDAAPAPRALPAGLGEGAPMGPDLVGREIVDVGLRFAGIHGLVNR